MSTEQPSLRKDSDESLNELEKELAALRAEIASFNVLFRKKVFVMKLVRN